MTRRSPRYVVVVGCGRLGSTLANRLSREGDSVVVIDPAAASFQRLSSEFSGFRVEADGSELAVLRQAKVAGAELVFAVTGDDQLNLMVAQLAQQVLGAARVVARVGSPGRAEVFAALGIEVICPLRLAAERLLAWADEDREAESE